MNENYNLWGYSLFRASHAIYELHITVECNIVIRYRAIQ